MTRMLNHGWLTAREKARLPHIRVHDLKHTFGRRLRAAGVSFEDRQDLLGHKSGRITTHYSVAKLSNLIEAANKVCERKNSSAIVLIKHLDMLSSVKIPQSGFESKMGRVENMVEAASNKTLTLVAEGGMEPPTQRFSVFCSTD